MQRGIDFYAIIIVEGTYLDQYGWGEWALYFYIIKFIEDIMLKKVG